MDNPKYASKTSADNQGIKTFLNGINIFSQKGMPKSIYFYRKASLSPPHPGGSQALETAVWQSLITQWPLSQIDAYIITHNM